MFWIAQLIASLFGLDISKVQRYVIVGTGILLVVLLIATGLWIRSCVSSHKAKHNLKVQTEQLAKINSANEQEKKAELAKVINENADVVVTVDQRNTIAESNDTQRQAEINVKVADAAQKISDAKASTGHDVTGPELDCLLIPEHCGAPTQ